MRFFSKKIYEWETAAKPFARYNFCLECGQKTKDDAYNMNYEVCPKCGCNAHKTVIGQFLYERKWVDAGESAGYEERNYRFIEREVEK